MLISTVTTLFFFFFFFPHRSLPIGLRWRAVAKTSVTKGRVHTAIIAAERSKVSAKGKAAGEDD